MLDKVRNFFWELQGCSEPCFCWNPSLSNVRHRNYLPWPCCSCSEMCIWRKQTMEKNKISFCTWSQWFWPCWGSRGNSEPQLHTAEYGHRFHWSEFITPSLIIHIPEYAKKSALWGKNNPGVKMLQFLQVSLLLVVIFPTKRSITQCFYDFCRINRSPAGTLSPGRPGAHLYNPK